eukprot:5101204-Lingulodinium_polyedra.AAC.1
MECVSVRFASRSANKTSIHPRRCVAFVERCTRTRLNQGFVGAAVRKPHVPAKPRGGERLGHVSKWGAVCAARCASHPTGVLFLIIGGLPANSLFRRGRSEEGKDLQARSPWFSMPFRQWRAPSIH